MAAHPGPSNYYQHYAYGSHSPGPAPAPYQYQFPLPPHMHPPPPRPPTYQNYHHPYPQPHSYTPPPPPQPKYPHPQPQHQAYSPSFAPWHPQQPLSPLPKQLSMLPPPTQPPAQEVSIPPQRTHVGSVNTAPSRPESPAHHPHTPGIWVIWSKRPSDPAAAPGIIISPRARPPSDVVHSALALPSPPPSPEPPAPKPELSREDHGLGKDHEAPSSATTATTDTATTATTTTPASSTAPDTPVPGSPLSTNTSLSLSAAVPKAERAPAEDKGAVPAEDKVAISAEDKVPISAEAQAVPVDEKSEAPSASDNAETAAAVDTPKPAPAPAPKKSWASLLRPSSPNSPKNPNSLPTSSVLGFSIPAESSLSSSLSPSAFPSSSSLNPNASPNAHALLALLSGTSNALGNLNVNGAPPLIRPRGLVNSGNMCFANAVLQVLVYCPPFARFFDALGALVGDGGFPSIAVDGGSEEGRSKTPLVDATVRFLREFRPRPSVSTSSSASPFASGSGSGNGSGSGSGNGKGKGVDRYAGAGERYDDDDALGLDSFVPTYVYDALRGEKRFDHMRGGHQEDAEEFLGFYLDTLEEELLALAASVEPSHESAPAAAVVGHGGQLQLQGHGVAAGQGAGQGQATEDQGWLEVGKRNRAVLTRTTKSADSPITRIFGGKFRSTLRVPHQKDSAVVEDWRALRLDIQREQIHTIRDALAFISAPQPVQVTSPTRPGHTLDGTQTVHIAALPPILVLHLKRFLYDPAQGGVAKVGKQVGFGAELEVGSDVMAPGKKMHTTRYKLFGVIYHHGFSASGGHYTLDVLHPNIDMVSHPTTTTTTTTPTAKSFSAATSNSRTPTANTRNTKPPAPPAPREGWIRIDDELVSDVRPEDVFGAVEGEGEGTQGRCAYLLFYRRVGGPVGR